MITSDEDKAELKRIGEEARNHRLARMGKLPRSAHPMFADLHKPDTGKMIRVKLNSALERIDFGGKPGLWIYVPKSAVGEQWQSLVDGLEHTLIGSQAIKVSVSGTVKLEVEKNG